MCEKEKKGVSWSEMRQCGKRKKERKEYPLAVKRVGARKLWQGRVRSKDRVRNGCV